ncbi:MAG: ABC transporter permease [Hydrococcus sp. C42_A2020_068]|uniref:ABC transporter permease n=1 Tax=Pleurocapsa sp. PCC 7327 TaxID=118163 RepID=UPI00029FB80E|nr:ABC transporter permease [Pleurocapsa sp. PCC 7327]AFY78313.1 ABC-type multidrug transport system, permease component [Pleurocapsa sp. PCC 7327]MBF2020339.1 ABC transporter permease [Hydrococcus sp. C42_A2020_068]
MNFINKILNSRFWALAIKEINQILRDKSLIFFLLFPPTIQLLIYGFALNPDVQNLKLGIVDYAQTNESQELVFALTEKTDNIFIADRYFLKEEELSERVREGKLTVGLVIPPDFQRKISQDRTAEIQVFIDGVDANTAGIANGYINQIIEQYNRNLESDRPEPLVDLQTTFLYNPGLISSWFFVPGMMGVIFTLISSLVSAGTVVREKDSGTLEQLLMTPAEAWEILLAKIVPLFVLLMGDVLLAVVVGRVVFRVPFQGNFLLFLVLSGLYIFVGIGIGIMLATISRTQQQAFLISFFINLPLIQLSGAIAPVESMPTIFQYLSFVNPLRHYVAIVRGILLKGIGLGALWQHAIVLLFFAVIILSVSISRFRRQLV